MENIISKVRATTFIHIAILEVTGTIFLCYGLAVANGHVPAWLPMISDCAVEAPEKYPFRLGIILGAILMMVEVILAYYSDTGFSKNRLCLILGLLASSGLGIVGAINEKENNTVHSSSAVVFFFGYEFYMIIMTWYSISEARVGIASLTVKQLCTIVAGIALIAFIVMSTNWGKHQLYIAMCEWIGTVCILVFQWTFAFDLSDIYVYEIKCDKPVSSQNVATDNPPSYYGSYNEKSEANE